MCEVGPPEIFFENAQAYEVFEACRSQWRTRSVMNGAFMVEKKTSLDFTAVLSVADAFGVADKRDCLQKIRVMQTAALEVMDENLSH